jgi:hypothetical protein
MASGDKMVPIDPPVFKVRRRGGEEGREKVK